MLKVCKMLGNDSQSRLWKGNMILTFPSIVLSTAKKNHDHGGPRNVQASVIYFECLLRFQN